MPSGSLFVQALIYAVFCLVGHSVGTMLVLAGKGQWVNLRMKCVLVCAVSWTGKGSYKRGFFCLLSEKTVWIPLQ